MVVHQEHFGRKFYQDKKTGYWISTDYPRIRAHRWVWISIHGNIPKGYHIHHKNENKSDNKIENLELIERSRHLSHHYTEEKREKSKKLCEKIRPLTKAWHASPEGIAWHRLHAIKSNFVNRPPIEKICELCSKKYLTKNISKGQSKFCSNKCKSSYRRKMKLDFIDKTCEVCKKIFLNNRYSKQRTCSRKCGNNLHKNKLT